MIQVDDAAVCICGNQSVADGLLHKDFGKRLHRLVVYQRQRCEIRIDILSWQRHLPFFDGMQCEMMH